MLAGDITQALRAVKVELVEVILPSAGATAADDPEGTDLVVTIVQLGLRDHAATVAKGHDAGAWNVSGESAYSTRSASHGRRGSRGSPR